MEEPTNSTSENVVTPEKILPGFSSLATPCLIVNRDVCERNAKAVLDKCKELGIKLRPHMKTHKTRELGEMMTGGTRRSIVVSTLAEAEFFADGGFDDILYAAPLIESKFGRCQQLIARLEEFHVLVDSKATVEALINTAVKQEGKRWSVFLAIDIGNGREGVQFDSGLAVQLAKMLDEADNVIFQGIYTHCGHTYARTNADEVSETSNLAAAAMLVLKRKLSQAGVEVVHCGIGSTPSAWAPGEQVKLCTEMHPGAYIFNDLTQSVYINCCDPRDVAIRVLARVVGVYFQRNELLLDSGFTALSQDRPVDADVFRKSGYAAVEGYPSLKVSSMTQELGRVTSDQPIDFEHFKVGTMLLLIPNHCCATACMHPEYHVVSGGVLVDTWRPCRGF